MARSAPRWSKAERPPRSRVPAAIDNSSRGWRLRAPDCQSAIGQQAVFEFGLGVSSAKGFTETGVTVPETGNDLAISPAVWTDTP